MPVAVPTLTPSPYIPLQAMTFTPIYPMEVSNSSRKIEKFSGRPGTIFLKEFKATFSAVVYELELKYDANYIEVFAFKQLVRYVHYEALDVSEQHFSKILDVIQIPNQTYAIAIVTTSQDALQTTIAHHGTVQNNPDLVPTLVKKFPQQFIVATANNPPTINALPFANPVGEFFRVLELEFLVKSFEKILQLATFSRHKDETLKMLYRKLLNANKREVLQAHATQVQTLQNEFKSLKA
jgi:hypothetical protein